MRNHERRAAREQRGHRPLDQLLALRVEIARRLVEDQDLRRREDRARDREPLLLPARELHAALADECLVALGQARDELVRVRAERRVLDLRVGRVVAAVRDVVAHGAVEQEHVLLHDREQAAVGLQVKLPDVDAVEQEPAARRIVEPRDEVRDRGLAGAAAADERDDGAARHAHAEVAHDGSVLAILERDVLELDLAHEPRRVRRVGPVGLVARALEHLEHALGRRERALELGERVHDLPDRVQQQERVPLKSHDVADRGATRHRQVTAVPDDHDVDRRQREAPRRPEPELAAVCEQLLAHDQVPAARVLEHLAELASKRSHDADARERLADAAVDALDVFADRPVDRPDPLRRDEAHEHGARHDRERDERELPVEHDQHAHGDHEPDHGDRRRHDRELQQPAGFHVVQPRERQVHEPLEQRVAQRQHHARVHESLSIVAREVQRRRNRDDGEERGAREIEEPDSPGRFEVADEQHSVDDEAHEQRLDHLEARAREREHEQRRD